MMLISAVLIVRNEAKLLPDCLASLRSVVDEILVVDTGSKDDTVAIAHQFGTRVVHFPWQEDFSAVRNFALEQAQGDWVLVIDADERVIDPEAARDLLMHFAETSVGETRVLGTVEILNRMGDDDDAAEVLDHTPRFFRRDSVRYQGRIHEQPVPLQGQGEYRSTGLRLLHLGYGLEREAAAAKAARNISLLKSECAAHPKDEYLWYQLGKSHFSVRQYAQAVQALQSSVERIDWSTSKVPRGCQGPLSRKVLTDLITTLAYALVNEDRGKEAHDFLLAQKEYGHPGVDRADFFHALGYVELLLGHLPAARAAYLQSLQLGAEREDVLGSGSYASHYHLGLIAEAEADLSAAWEHYVRSLRQKPSYATTLRRVVDLSAERRIQPPEAVLQAAEPAALHRIYLECLRKYLENAQIQEAGHLAKSAAQWDPALFQACRGVLQNFARAKAYLQEGSHD